MDSRLCYILTNLMTGCTSKWRVPRTNSGQYPTPTTRATYFMLNQYFQNLVVDWVPTWQWRVQKGNSRWYPSQPLGPPFRVKPISLDPANRKELSECQSEGSKKGFEDSTNAGFQGTTFCVKPIYLEPTRDRNSPSTKIKAVQDDTHPS